MPRRVAQLALLTQGAADEQEIILELADAPPHERDASTIAFARDAEVIAYTRALFARDTVEVVAELIAEEVRPLKIPLLEGVIEERQVGAGLLEGRHPTPPAGTT